MTLSSYIATNFDARMKDLLMQWQRQFDRVPLNVFIQRNIDRECRRKDIKRAVWDDFLRTVASGNAVSAVDRILDVIRADPRRYFLPGRAIRFAPKLYRYIRLNHFLKGCRIAKRRFNETELAAQIDNGKISGLNLEGKTLGYCEEDRSHVVWVTNHSLAGESEGMSVRDRLGLGHLPGCIPLKSRTH